MSDVPPPLTPDDFATFMADCIVANEGNIDKAKLEGMQLAFALLADLGYAEGVLIYGEMSRWYDETETGGK